MPVLELGWTTLALAEAYFINERYVTTFWDAVATDDLKNRLLNMAYNRIFYHPELVTPEAGTETATQLVILTKAQSEMAYYLALHLADEDRRKGIQAQGVIEAGIVKEKYWTEMLEDLPVPPFVLVILSGFSVPGIYAVGIDRDENDDIDEGEGS